MYRNIKAIIIVVSVLLSACDDKLDLSPAQEIDEKDALSSLENVQAVLIGAYDELGVNDLFGGETLRNSELLGGDGELLWAGTFNAPREMFNKNMQTVNGDATEVWLEGYETINMVNNVLSALDIINDADDRNRLEGESKFIRAMVYFELVRFFALPYEAGQTNNQFGVILKTDPTRGFSESDFVGRNSVEEIYTQIINDLTDAIAVLPEDNGVFTNVDAATALRARVHLQMGNFSAARNDANSVIEAGNYSLVDNIADAFNQDANTSEDLFAIQVSTQDGVNSMNTYFATPQFGARDGDIEILDAHVDLYPDGDDRGALFYEDGGRQFTSKFTNQFANVPILRLAEMYLIRAEGNVRLGETIGDTPLNDINEVRGRSNAPALTTVDLDDVLYERRLELAFEGHKIHDIRRLQLSVGGFPYDAPELLFPIPQREIDANPGLDGQQNPGY